MISDEFYPDSDLKLANDQKASTGGGRHSDDGFTNMNHSVADILHAPPPSPEHMTSDDGVGDTSVVLGQKCSTCAIYMSVVANKQLTIDKLNQDVRFAIKNICLVYDINIKGVLIVSLVTKDINN